MSYTDEQLRDAAAFLRKAYCASLPDVSNYHPEYSKEFLKKMDRLCRQYRLRQKAKAFFKTVVAAVVALLITGSVWLGLNVDARAIFQAWLIEIYENTFIYRFFEESSVDELLFYDIQSLPDGYVFIKDVNTSTTHMKLYSNGEIDLVLMYFEKSNQIALGTAFAERIETTVGKNPADFYQATDGSSNDLIWFDSNSGMVFVLSGFLPKEQMIKIAKSVIVTSIY